MIRLWIRFSIGWGIFKRNTCIATNNYQHPRKKMYRIRHLLKQDEKTMEKPDLEAKVRASGFGSHTTTLSSKYDARKPDESWLCVFCKRSSHYQVTPKIF